MIRSLLTLTAVVLAAWTITPAGARPDDKAEVKMKGTLVCGACTLSETKKCVNILQVTEKEKLVNYSLDDKGTKEDYHDEVCGGGKVENVTVTGIVSEKEGKKFLKPSKVDIKK